MPERPMYRSPHKKINGWAKGYLPEFGPTHGSNTGGHSGNMPPGKKKRADRVKSEPPGFPRGRHVDDATIARQGLVACFCGGCFHKNDGTKRLVR